MKINTLDLNSYLLLMWEALQRATPNTNTLTLFNSPVYSTDVPFVGTPIVWDGIQNLSYTYDQLGNLSFETKRAIVVNTLEKVAGTQQRLQVYGYIPITNHVEFETNDRYRRTSKRRQIDPV